MKLKKLLIGILCCACAVFTIFGFTSCKDPKKPVVYKDEYITAKGYTEYVNLGDGYQGYDYIIEFDRVVPEVTDEHSWAEYDVSTGITANAGYSIQTWYSHEGKTEEDVLLPQNGTVLYGTNDYYIDVVNGEGNIVRSYAILINGVCKSSDHVWSEWGVEGKCFGKAAELRSCSKCGKAEKRNVIDRAWHNYVEGVCDLCTKEVTPLEYFIFDEVDGNLAIRAASEEFPENVIIPDYYQQQKITAINGSAFYQRSEIKSIRIPDTITVIGESAFQNCSNLRNINIPETVTSLGEYGSCFSGCASLEEILIPYGITKITDATFYDCTSLTTVSIPNSVTEIGNSAFRNCSSLSTIELPANLLAIGDSAFNNSGLKSLFIPEGVTTIGENAFYSCNMTSISIPNSVVSIGINALPNNDNLTYTIYDTAKYLGNASNPYLVLAQAELYGKASFTIHNDTKVLYGYLGGTPNATKLTIPKNVISISYRSLDQLQRVDTYYVAEENTAFKAIEGNLYTIDGKTLVSYATGKTATEFVVPEGVTTIAEQAFRYNGALSSITIPVSITSIKYAAFKGLYSLTTLNYNGTKADWAKIEFDPLWNGDGGVTITSIVCTDGTITLENSSL